MCLGSSWVAWPGYDPLVLIFLFGLFFFLTGYFCFRLKIRKCRILWKRTGVVVGWLWTCLSWVKKQTLHGFQPCFKVPVTSAGQWLNACPPISTWHLGLHKSDLCFPWSCLLLVPYPVWASWFFLLFQGSALFVEYLNHFLALLAGSVCPCGLLGVCSSLPSVRKILGALHTVLLHLSEL